MIKDKEVLCNFCGNSCFLPNGMDGNCGLVNAKVSGGYTSTPGNGRGALDDCSGYRFSLCEFCCDWMFSNFKLSPEEYDYMDGGKIEFRPAAERVKNDDWRKNKDVFFKEYEKRNKDRGQPLSFIEKNIKDIIE